MQRLECRQIKFPDQRSYLLIEPISIAHVERTLEKLNERKATGYDGIPPKIMKIGAAQLTSSLAIPFNSSLPADVLCGEATLTHVSTIENGLVNGNEVNGFRLLKEMTLKRLTITDQ